MRSLACLALLTIALNIHAQDSLRNKPTLQDTIVTRTLDAVVVSASRTQEKLMQSPVTIEKVNKDYFAASAAPTFFDALQSVKGVQMITPSLGFRVINTRGFANTTNVRFAQLTDGIDVQSPHIGAPVGNALGPNDLDINSVEIVPGAASALYGMNTINGMANFLTKNPFTSEGVCFQQKTGVNHLNGDGVSAKIFSETSLRVAHKFSERFAAKVNASFIEGYDWIADDRQDLNANANGTTNLTGSLNPALDPVNGYGNESSNRRALTLQGKSYVVARTGYFERELTEYPIRNIRADAGLYFRPTANTALTYTYHLAKFNTVYQRANRFRLKDYVLQQHALDYSSANIKAKLYINTENTGESYNIRSMGENIDRSFKTDDDWFSQYSSAFNAGTTAGQDAGQAHMTARAMADQGRPQPGTEPFNATLAKLQGINNWDSGAALRVKASMVHGEIQADLTNHWLAGFRKASGIDILVGMDHRSYIINPDGNYFVNPNPSKSDQNIVYSRTGGFASLTRSFLHQRVKAGLVVRLDKNDYFKTNTNVRESLVYSPVQRHNIRASYQNGYRYPSIFEAYSNVNSGGVKRVGGLRVMSDGIFEYSWLKSSIDAFQAAVTRDINTLGLTKSASIERNKGILKKSDYTYLKPEHVQSFEGGYKGLFANNRLFIDVDFYYNRYNAFIAQVEVSVPFTQNPDSIPVVLADKKTQGRYRMWTNSNTTVHNYGSGLQAKYNFGRGYVIDGNVSYSKLKKKKNGDGLEDGFNTPQWMCNISVNNAHIIGNLGAAISWRWQDSYYWQSFLVNGQVPAVSSVDAQLSYGLKKSPIQFKIGATNCLNTYKASFLGGPQVGGFYYTSVTYGLK